MWFLFLSTDVNFIRKGEEKTQAKFCLFLCIRHADMK